MSEQQLPTNGSFCWNELGTTNLETAKKFYSELLGWKLKESGPAGTNYNEIVIGECSKGGMFQMGAEFGDTPSHWTPYVAVDDVDAKAKQVTELGGKVRVPPTEVPNVGRFCMITDPTGATISLITLTGAHS
ncbi:MAG: VOC family protein [Acidobacteriota bacterium]|nr:VOC family protein [Acidobacteriota bacterium]